VWLAGDHYKWRAMRSDGAEERYCTGNATEEEKFARWAETVPRAIGNPLYVWTHLELRRYFGVNSLLSPATASRVYAECGELLRTPEYSARNLMRRMRVKAVCTTDDPADDLQYHRRIRDDGFEIRVLPTFRPDRAMLAEDPVAYNAYLDRLSRAADVEIDSWQSLVEALRRRHAYFHNQGCRLSDHGLETVCAEEYTQAELDAAFARVRAGSALPPEALAKLKSAVMLECGRMDAERCWVQQLHLGAMRNNNGRLFAALGPDTGFDSIGDGAIARPLSRFLDRLDREGRLPKTIIYTLNPCANEVIASMLGNFQDGSAPGKLQFGSGWWFLDQRDGMQKQLTALANLGLLSRFVGMLTDSRSFLSYPRHEYFRRILCRLLGEWVEAGEVPEDLELLGRLVEDVSFGNAKRYFGIELQ